MNKINDNLWKQVWNERGNDYPTDNPMAISGFDQAFGTINNENFKFLISDLALKLEVNENDQIIEIGCGAGAITNELHKTCKNITGCDLSTGMVNRAKKLFPHISFFTANPSQKIASESKYTKIYMHSVFQYFPDYDYAKKVILNLTEVADSKAIILLADIMDLDTKEEYLNYRNSQKSTKSIWQSSVKGRLEHLYYAKDFFINISNEFPEWKFEILERNIQGYQNSNYRYDVKISR